MTSSMPQPDPATGSPPGTTANPSTTGADPGDEDSAGVESGDDESTDGDGFFISHFDVDPRSECSILGGEDCPAGFKCTPWANDGGMTWNAQRCVPVVDDPQGPGDPCTAFNSPWSGEDDCDANSMCWGVDPRTLEGECFPFCEGTLGSPTCEGDAWCSVGAEGILPLCLPVCDPVMQNCPAGQGCYPVEGTFVCAPDESDGGGNPYESCEFINGCTVGTACVPPDNASQCELGASGCCVPFCDTGSPDCTGGTICEPWYASGEAPDNPGASNIGICVDPS